MSPTLIIALLALAASIVLNLHLHHQHKRWKGLAMQTCVELGKATMLLMVLTGKKPETETRKDATTCH